MIEINIGALVVLLGIPTAVTGGCSSTGSRSARSKRRPRRPNDRKRQRPESVQRIPDAHCNGDMHAALDYAAKIKHAQKGFLTSQGIHAIID